MVKLSSYIYGINWAHIPDWLAGRTRPHATLPCKAWNGKHDAL